MEKCRRAVEENWVADGMMADRAAVVTGAGRGTGREVGLGFCSRNRETNSDSSFSVLG